MNGLPNLLDIPLLYIISWWKKRRMKMGRNRGRRMMMKEGEKDEENSIERLLLLMICDSCVHRKQAGITLPLPATASFPALSLEPRNMLSLALSYILAPGTMNCVTRTLPSEGALSWTPGDEPTGLPRDTQGVPGHP